MDLDQVAFDVECPRCEFLLRIRYRDARLRDVLICRGCKGNIQLDDNMNQCRKARQQFCQMLKELKAAVGQLNITLRL